MTLADCIKFANENLNCSIATVEGDKPRVRIFAMWFADETGFYFHSGAMKAVVKQLEKNSNMEVCFFKPDPEMKTSGTMLRVAGKVEFLHDKALNERLLEDRPFLKDMGYTSPEDPGLSVFRITTGEAWFWTVLDNTNESGSERIRF